MKKSLFHLGALLLAMSCSLNETEYEPFFTLRDGELLNQAELFDINQHDITAHNSISSAELMDVIEGYGWESSEFYAVNENGRSKKLQIKESDWEKGDVAPYRFFYKDGKATYYYWAIEAFRNATFSYDEKDNTLINHLGAYLDTRLTKIVYIDQMTLILVAPAFSNPTDEIGAYVAVFRRASSSEVERWQKYCDKDYMSLPMD